jgi:hypothetical protein
MILFCLAISQKALRNTSIFECLPCYEDRYRGTHTTLTIALHGGLYIDIIMDRNRGPQTALTIALHGGFYLAIIIDRCGGH